MAAMEIRQEQSLKLLQKLVLTPQLQLAIRLLQLSRLELAEEIRTQLDSNPVLEEDGSGEDNLSYQDTAREGGDVGEPAPAEAPPKAVADPLESGNDGPHESPTHPDEGIDWERFVEGYNRFSSGPELRISNDDYPSIESTISRKSSLSDHLLWQLQLSDLDDMGREVGAFIIGNLNEDGYLQDVDEAEIAARTSSDEAFVRTILLRVQSFDPVGVAARDLRDCLLIQARHHHPDNERLRLLLENHLSDLERKNFKAIARGLKCTLDEVKILVDTVVGMDPRPGRAFATDEVVYVQPDVYVYKVGNDYITVLNEDGLPKLKISPYYEAALGGGARSDAREFVQEKLRAAMWLIRSIHQRQGTIRKVTDSIMRFQRDFLDNGVTHLRPLVLRDVAEDVGMHESTISRVTTSKYVHTPRGIFELKYFFNSRIGSVHGEDQSSASVKSRIQALIEAEDSTNPLSDQEIVEKLRRENIVIARRTVAKYRDVLGVLPSSRRRELV
jgi:RNA polymerase sigma-54 factor